MGFPYHFSPSSCRTLKNKSADTVIMLIYKYVYYKYKANASKCYDPSKLGELHAE